MKTKKILMLMAAMLLSCTCAFAQNGSNTPAKGDVNDDGTVDVADIVAVIDIMKNGGGTATVGYFYLGTTQPTAENYKTLPGMVTTYSSIDEAVGATASVAAGETVFMLCPAAWVSGKNVTLEDKTGNAIDFLEEKDATTISGYVIYKTQALNAPNDVVLKTQPEQEYYWYAGQTQPTSISETPTVDDTNFTNNKWHTLNANQINKTITGGTAGNSWYVAVPTAKGFKFYDSTLTEIDETAIILSNITVNGISYDVWKSNSRGAKTNVYMK